MPGASGMPEIVPVPELKVAQEGNPVIDRPESPAAILGVNDHKISCLPLVIGLPEIKVSAITGGAGGGAGDNVTTSVLLLHPGKKIKKPTTIAFVNKKRVLLIRIVWIIIITPV